MSRSIAREIAFKVIYSKLFNEEEEDTLAMLQENMLEAEDIAFTSELIKGFSENKDNLKDVISSNLKGYTIDRLNKIDLALIYLALTEIEVLNVPKQIVINEVVDMAKKYSTERSPKFINGFLASILNK